MYLHSFQQDWPVLTFHFPSHFEDIYMFDFDCWNKISSYLSDTKVKEMLIEIESLVSMKIDFNFT